MSPLIGRDLDRAVHGGDVCNLAEPCGFDRAVYVADDEFSVAWHVHGEIDSCLVVAMALVVDAPVGAGVTAAAVAVRVNGANSDAFATGDDIDTNTIRAVATFG